MAEDSQYYKSTCKAESKHERTNGNTLLQTVTELQYRLVLRGNARDDCYTYVNRYAEASKKASSEMIQEMGVTHGRTGRDFRDVS